MGIRESLNENRAITLGAAIGATVLAVLWIVYFSVNVNTRSPDVPATQPATVDDL